MDASVMVVGEDSSFRRYVRLTLQQAGYTTQEAGSVEQMAQRLGESPPCAVVYDCAFGEKGDRLLSALAAAGYDAGAVVWVTSGLLGERPVGPRVLVKPFDPRELVRLLENVLQKPAA